MREDPLPAAPNHRGRHERGETIPSRSQVSRGRRRGASVPGRMRRKQGHSGRADGARSLGLARILDRHPADLQPPLHRLSRLSWLALQCEARLLPRRRPRRIRDQSLRQSRRRQPACQHGSGPDHRRVAAAGVLSHPQPRGDGAGPAQSVTALQDGGCRLSA